MKPEGVSVAVLVAELQEALAFLRADGDGPGDPRVDEIAIALKANTAKAMAKAAASWREFRGCCAWMNDGPEQGGDRCE